MGREDWDRDHQAAKSAKAGVLPHQVAVRHLIRAADLNDPAPVERQIEGSRQIREHVLDADRLSQGSDPSGGDHHREPFDQRPDHFERQAARAEDDRGPKLERGNTRLAEDSTDRLAAPEMGRQFPAVAQPAQVDDAAHTARASGRHQRLGSRSLLVLKGAGRAHGMGQEIHRVDPGPGSLNGRRVGEISAHHFGTRPNPPREVFRAPGQATEPFTASLQHRE